MRKLPLICAASSLLVIFGSSNLAAQGPAGLDPLDERPSLLAHITDIGVSDIQEVTLRGVVNRINYGVKSTRTRDRVVFDIFVNNYRAQVYFRNSDLPNVDFHTIEDGLTSNAGGPVLRFSIEFGQIGGCFAARPSPKKLVLGLDGGGRIFGSWLDAEGCAVIWHQIRFSPIRSRVYSATLEAGTL